MKEIKKGYIVLIIVLFLNEIQANLFNPEAVFDFECNNATEDLQDAFSQYAHAEILYEKSVK